MKKNIKPLVIFIISGLLLLAAGCGKEIDKSWSSGYWDTVFFEDTPIAKKTNFSILFMGSDFTESADLPSLTARLFSENNMTAAVETRVWKLAYLNEHYADYIAGKIPSIDANKYDLIVFQGIYGDNDAMSALSFHADFKTKGVTSRIILMPYHDEPSHAAKWVRDKFTDVGFVDWRGLIEVLFNKGFGDPNLMNDDWLLRPNALNGYFGVYLMYLRLFDEAPTLTACNKYILETYSELIPGLTEAEKNGYINVAINEANKLAQF